MISNPIKVFVTGNDKKWFEYEGGSTLYHFCPRDNGLSKVMECNLIFLANDEVHARDVLKRMFQFVIDCNKEYSERMASGHDRHDFIGRSQKQAIKWQNWLDAIETINLTLAPTNQFYIVGWADNDTI